MACGRTTPLTADKRHDTEDDLLPPYTMEERMRELRQHLVLLRWRAQRLRNRQHAVVAHAGPLVFCS